MANVSSLGDFEPDEIGAAVTALREAAGLTRENLTDLDYSPSGWSIYPPQVELIEDYGGLSEVWEVAFYASVLDVTPGEFLDAVIAVAEAQRIDVQAEIEENKQADQLLDLLQENGGAGLLREEMELRGIPDNNVALNILYDRGIEVERVKRPRRKRSTEQETVGYRLKELA